MTGVVEAGPYKTHKMLLGSFLGLLAYTHDHAFVTSLAQLSWRFSMQ